MFFAQFAKAMQDTKYESRYAEQQGLDACKNRVENPETRQFQSQFCSPCSPQSKAQVLCWGHLGQANSHSLSELCKQTVIPRFGKTY